MSYFERLTYEIVADVNVRYLWRCVRCSVWLVLVVRVRAVARLDRLHYNKV